MIPFAALFFLSSGLFLGWSLGANDAANVFGTAVSTRMLPFRRAAFLCASFVVLGAVSAGQGTSDSLGALGNLTALPGAFTVALAAGATVALMTQWGVPVSTTQAIVGAILGWNLFCHRPFSWGPLSTLAASWVYSPILAGGIAALGRMLLSYWLRRHPVHLFRLDAWTRRALIGAGIFGAYSLGANNIANVMGVFVPVNPFSSMSLSPWGPHFSASQSLFLAGGLAIALGVWTHSRRVMDTVGNDIFRLSPLDGLLVVLATALVLFLFSSPHLQDLLRSLGLPPLPLVPVSSSQAVVGAVVGISSTRRFSGLHLQPLVRIALGWGLTPLGAGLLTFFLLFFVQNLFGLRVS